MMALIAIIGVMTTLAPAEAAVRYRFTQVTEGAYARRVAGTVVVDGRQWRISYDPRPDAVSDLTAIVRTDDSGLLAINDTNQTFFRLQSRKRLAVDSSLFRFGNTVRASRIRVSVLPAEPDSTQGVSGSMTRVTFSYRIESSAFSEKVRGEVWGEIRIWTIAHGQSDVPWKPLELQTDLDTVDEALGAAFAKIEGFPWQTDVEVSRRLEGGMTLKQITRRTITNVTGTSADSGMFKVPADYHYQEPIIGAPGARPKQ